MSNSSEESVWQTIISEALAETIFLPDSTDVIALRAIWVRMHQRIQMTLDTVLAKRFVELTESEQDLITCDHLPFIEFVGLVRSAP